MDTIKRHFFFFGSSLADTLVDGSGASIDTSVKGLSGCCGAGLRFDSEYSLNEPRSEVAAAKDKDRSEVAFARVCAACAPRALRTRGKSERAVSRAGKSESSVNILAGKYIMALPCTLVTVHASTRRTPWTREQSEP